VVPVTTINKQWSQEEVFKYFEGGVSGEPLGGEEAEPISLPPKVKIFRWEPFGSEEAEPFSLLPSGKKGLKENLSGARRPSHLAFSLEIKVKTFHLYNQWLSWQNKQEKHCLV
jgi:hypothetical protein